MADWNIIGLSGFASATIAIVLSIFYFPLFFLGPLLGGFLAVYFSRGYEDYDKMDRKDGAVIGVLSGIIGGLITSVFFLLMPGMITAVIGILNTRLGAFGDSLLAGYLLIQLTIVSSMIFSGLGGIIGIAAKN